MDISPILKNYKKIVESIGKSSFTHVGDTIYIIVEPNKLRELAEILYWKMNCYHRTCVGVDERPLNGHFALYHIFGDDTNGLHIVVKVYIDPEDPVVPSITDIVPAADWCELEAYDLLGIKFSGRKLYRLVLPPTWPHGVYPLRKETPYNYRPSVKIISGEEIGESHDKAVVPVGPYHPALHEPEYFELYVEGERVVDVKYRGFHVHRGIEKLGESRTTYQQVNFLAERICGICGFEHSVCYALAVEKAAKIDVPERAQYIRSIVLEIERIHSHLLWIGVAAHVLGYDTGFMHIWRIRELVMYIAEKLTGSRKTYGINLIGGVRKDINEEKKKEVIEKLEIVEKDLKKLIDTMVSVPELKKRLTGTGILPKSEARKLSVVGPTARGSGLDRDIRRDLPYAAYSEISFKVPVYSEGDNLARFLVRVEEVFESISIVKQLLDQLPRGDIMAESIEIPERKMGVAAVEAPRGEDVHFIITGRGKPYRWKVRAPTYNNIPALKVMLRDQALADAPLTIASIDPCFSCTDRIVVIKDGRRYKLIPNKGGVVLYG
ncbi:MAG: hydrogenase 3 large subunit [Desulfurococcales archaeon ex4484_58]|nr:MAG: hydrogenase 3 large subunit [Desulfurococcales archaeon ex4484_58]